jgi:hypothetical protein
MEEKKEFKRGDFLKRDNRRGSFMIYEGNNISDTCVKKMTLVCAYDPEKYMQTAMGYDHVPYLDVSTKKHRCADTIDTEKEDFWIKLCTPSEKEEAINVLKEYGYVWDEENLAMVDILTGEIVKRIIIPDNKYYGEIIKPITETSKNILKQFCLSKSKPIYTPNYREDWDYYD